MTSSVRIPYSGIGDTPQSISLMPRLSMRLFSDTQLVDINGIIDSGASVNVLPYSIGVRLGADWNSQPSLTRLGGNLSSAEVRALAMRASHPDITDANGVELLFAWANTDNTAILFGQINFFLLFDVCFFRTEQVFEIKRR